MKHLLIAFLILVGCASAAGAQTPDAPSAPPQFYVGSSMFVLANLVTDEEPPYFYQVNVGYQLTPKDRLTVEAITWRYYHPLGVTYGDRDASSAYPGHVREFGVGIDYQRTLPKNFFTSIAAVPFFRRYYNTQNEKIGNGMQLYFTGRFGYHLDLSNRLFVEPSVAFNYWPVSTNVPDTFKAQDDRWSSYFLFEPGLHFGFRF